MLLYCPTAFAPGSAMGPCGTWIRVCAENAGRVRLSGCHTPEFPNRLSGAQCPSPGPSKRPSWQPRHPSPWQCPKGEALGGLPPASSELLRDNGVISPIPPSYHFPMARACSTAATSSYANIAGSGPITAMNTDAAASRPAAPAAAPNSTPLPAL